MDNIYKNCLECKRHTMDVATVMYIRLNPTDNKKVIRDFCGAVTSRSCYPKRIICDRCKEFEALDGKELRKL